MTGHLGPMSPSTSLFLFPCPLSHVPCPTGSSSSRSSSSITHRPSLYIKTLVLLLFSNKPTSLKPQTLSLSIKSHYSSFHILLSNLCFVLVGVYYNTTTMELQLGLALPANNNFPIKGGLDLNINDFLYHPAITDSNNNKNKNKKRSFAQAFESSNAASTVPRTLPWLLWNNQPNDDDDDDDTKYNSRYTIMVKNEEDGLVGWPPIKSWRKETCFHIHGNGGVRHNRTVGVNGGGVSTFVKVKMEGVGIARKIDLSLHHSLETLVRTLMHMFDKCEMDSDNYKLTYQDREGDWLLADDQDVSWRTFMRSVQRLKLLKRMSSTD